MINNYSLEQEKLDLSPAKWIWFPSERTLANTFVLFRREITIKNGLKKADGWITADSRYRFTIDGIRVQWGPAPCDPRTPEADYFDITDLLQSGHHVIGVEVLYYGHGDGTWVTGKPGFLFNMELEYEDGVQEQILSDENWMTLLDRSHRPGQYKRWYLRSLQEDFDARWYPYGWNKVDFKCTEKWVAPMILGCTADKPSLFSNYRDYLFDSGYIDANDLYLRKRRILPLKEEYIPIKSLADNFLIHWNRDPLDWFDFRTPNSFNILEKQPQICQLDETSWEVTPSSDSNEATVLTFELEEQMVGWPCFSIEAPEGTVIELMTQEAHEPSKHKWMDNHFFCWTRFTCREGLNHFETFDFESLRWMQFHIRNTTQPVKISTVGVRRRSYNWSNKPFIRCSEPKLQRLFDAGINTLQNAAQETLVDGMGRERQQYSGDIGHGLHAVRYAFGDIEFSSRFLYTYSEGLTTDGYLIDCWPAYDRMVRMGYRQIGLTKWGPIIDHSVQFVFDCWDHYMETGKKEALIKPFNSVIKIADYLKSLIGKDGLLPVEEIGLPTVWMDNSQEYKQQRHKQCAFNLYVSAMFIHPLNSIYQLFGYAEEANQVKQLGKDILKATVKKYWCEKNKIFVNNLPWCEEDGEELLCDRSLATSILFDQCPGGDVQAALKALVERPDSMGISFPANAGWRYWALSKMGRADVIIKEMRCIWASLDSVIKNNTLPEHWSVSPDSTDQWSHMPVAPIYNLFMDIAGIRPTKPGFEKVAIRPQLGDIENLELTAHTPKGAIHFSAVKIADGHEITITLPQGCSGEVILPNYNQAENMVCVRMEEKETKCFMCKY